MNDRFFAEQSVWLTQAGLAGTAETDIVNGFCDRCVAAGERWTRSPFYQMLRTGDSLLRRRLAPEALAEFTVLPEMHAAGMTDYVAIINRFAAEGTIGDMDCVYSSWATSEPDGFSDGQIAALQRIVPFLALAIKSVSLAHMTGT